MRCERGRVDGRLYLRFLTFSLERAPEIVDNDVGTAGAEEGGICLAQPSAGAGNDDGLVVEA